MKPKLGVDTNFIFRWKDNPSGLDYSYDVHHAFGLVWFQKMGPPAERFDPNLPTDYWPTPVNYQLTNGQIYHWRVEVNGNYVQVYVINSQGVTTKLFDFSDANKPYLNGGVGLRVTTGAVFPTEVYYDNVVVTGIKKGLEVPFFSQRDNGNNWWDQEYDSASGLNPVGLREIEDWGCAMTSAAMVLRYHGFTKGPDGQDTNPLTLNQYLKDNGGYSQYGGVLWPYISKYAKDAKSNGQVSSSLPSLEFTYSTYSKDLLADDIEATNPGIIKIVMNDKGTPTWNDDNLHFVVGKGVENNTVYINDPLDLEDNDATLSGNYSAKTFRQIARFTKSNSDLSYVWLEVGSPNVNVLFEQNGLKLGKDAGGNAYDQIPGGQYLLDGVIQNGDTPPVRFAGDSQSSQSLLLPKPTDGDYQITFSAAQPTQTNFSVHAFNEQAQVQVFRDEAYIIPNNPITLKLNYSKTDESQFAKLNKQVSFGTLKQEVQALYEQRLISKSMVKSLLSLLTTAEKNYPLFPRLVGKILVNWEKLVKKATPRLMTVEAKNLLLGDLQILRQNLGL